MCLNPLKGWLDERKQVCKVSRAGAVGARFDDYNGWLTVYDKSDLKGRFTTDFIDIPCRNCPECYAQSRREWISRAVAESQLHDSMIFLTLTYSDDKIPISEMVVEDTGEIFKHQTLRYRDFQLFMKRLRKYLDDRKVRFMVCGEYGSRTYRPHYHAILFGVSLDDFGLSREHSMNSHGDILYTNEVLERLWSNGYVLGSAANTNTIAYVAGYVAKKSSVVRPKAFFQFSNCVPPFIRGSNRPGLGVPWFDRNIGCFDSIYDYVSVPTDTEPVKIRLTPSWKEKWERRQIYEPLVQKGLIEHVEHDKIKSNQTDYYLKKVARRVRLIDPLPAHRRTDMSKDDYNSARNTDFRNSLRRKRGTY